MTAQQSCLTILTVSLAMFAPARAFAGVHLSPVEEVTPFIWYAISLTQGVSYTIETANKTPASADPVLIVLRYNTNDGTYTKVAADDDSAGDSNARATFIAPTTGYYRIWVRAFGTGGSGLVDLLVNGQTHLAQNQFGGRRTDLQWNIYQKFRVAGKSATGSKDFMLFLLRSNLEYIQHDDDSGPNLYPFLWTDTTETALTARAFHGTYPGFTGTAQLSKDDDTLPGINDPDEDGISSSLEILAGTAGGDSDTDADMIPDTMELFGNDGFSYSEYGAPNRRTAFVEIDFMTGATDPKDDRQPYAGFAADVASVFKFDSPDQVDLHIFVDNSVPWHEVTTFDQCSSYPGRDCVREQDIKAVHFSPNNPERRAYFHYAVWAFRYGVSNGKIDCGGVADYLGNDAIIALQCDVDPKVQRSIFTHEFGHNLNLGHNNNESAGGSVVHLSVMNYTYAWAGGVPPTNRATYSWGNNGCAPCATSPKQACQVCRNSFLGCGWPGCSACDCDINEWAAVNFDATGSPTWDLALSTYANTRHIGVHEKIDPPRWRQNLTAVSREARLARVAALKSNLISRDMQEGRDFLVSDDGVHIYSVCR